MRYNPGRRALAGGGRPAPEAGALQQGLPKDLLWSGRSPEMASVEPTPGQTPFRVENRRAPGGILS